MYLLKSVSYKSKVTVNSTLALTTVLTLPHIQIQTLGSWVYGLCHEGSQYWRASDPLITMLLID